jgi:mannitol/fructose-specific phosphotransferase system IIA component
MEVKRMRMVKLLIQVPQPIKARLDAMRTQGYTASGYIRALLERELTHTSKVRQKGKYGTQRTG